MGFNLGDISPLAGIVTGKGMIGKLAGKGILGFIPKMIANDAQEQRAAEAEAERIAGEEKKQASMLARAAAPATQMKKGGAVKKMAKGGVTRADGCITKGHTKGRMV